MHRGGRDHDDAIDRRGAAQRRQDAFDQRAPPDANERFIRCARLERGNLVRRSAGQHDGDHAPVALHAASEANAVAKRVNSGGRSRRRASSSRAARSRASAKTQDPDPASVGRAAPAARNASTARLIAGSSIAGSWKSFGIRASTARSRRVARLRRTQGRRSRRAGGFGVRAGRARHRLAPSKSSPAASRRAPATSASLPRRHAFAGSFDERRRSRQEKGNVRSESAPGLQPVHRASGAENAVHRRKQHGGRIARSAAQTGFRRNVLAQLTFARGSNPVDESARRARSARFSSPSIEASSQAKTNSSCGSTSISSASSSGTITLRRPWYPSSRRPSTSSVRLILAGACSVFIISVPRRDARAQAGHPARKARPHARANGWGMGSSYDAQHNEFCAYVLSEDRRRRTASCFGNYKILRAIDRKRRRARIVGCRHRSNHFRHASDRVPAARRTGRRSSRIRSNASSPFCRTRKSRSSRSSIASTSPKPSTFRTARHSIAPSPSSSTSRSTTPARRRSRSRVFPWAMLVGQRFYGEPEHEVHAHGSTGASSARRISKPAASVGGADRAAPVAVELSLTRASLARVHAARHARRRNPGADARRRDAAASRAREPAHLRRVRVPHRRRAGRARVAASGGRLP